MEPTKGCQKCDVSTLGVGTGTLEELAGSHTRLAIYPALAIHPPSYHQTTKVTLTKSSPEMSGYMHIDKQVTLSILIMLVPREAPRQLK